MNTANFPWACRPFVARWLAALALTAWAVHLLVRPMPVLSPRAASAAASLPAPASGAAAVQRSDLRLVDRGGKRPPGTDGPGRWAEEARPRVGVSPQLEREILWLRDAYRDSVEGHEPLERPHAVFTAGWAFNMMVDAAYQDALDLGLRTDPHLARLQVLQVLEESR